MSENYPEIDNHLDSMCTTWRHDYGLLSPDEQAEVRKQLWQLYIHHVAPLWQKVLEARKVAEMALIERDNTQAKLGQAKENGEEYREMAREFLRGGKQNLEFAKEMLQKFKDVDAENKKLRELCRKAVDLPRVVEHTEECDGSCTCCKYAYESCSVGRTVLELKAAGGEHEKA